MKPSNLFFTGRNTAITRAMEIRWYNFFGWGGTRDRIVLLEMNPRRDAIAVIVMMGDAMEPLQGNDASALLVAMELPR
jgi:hypothetical protein